MTKVFASILIIFTLLLIAGSIWIPNDFIMWFASTTEDFIRIRITLIALLLVIIFTNPPRSPVLRMTFGASAAALGLWTFGQAYANNLHILDIMILLQAAVILGIEALEYSENNYYTRATERTTQFAKASPMSVLFTTTLLQDTRYSKSVR